MAILIDLTQVSSNGISIVPKLTSHKLSKINFNLPWDLSRYNQILSAPAIIGTIENKQSFSCGKNRILDMPIKLANSDEYFLPTEAKLAGILSEIIYEVKELEQNDKRVVHELTDKSRSIIFMYNTDPVIRTYLQQKGNWETKISDLKSEVSSLENNWEDE